MKRTIDPAFKIAALVPSATVLWLTLGVIVCDVEKVTVPVKIDEQAFNGASAKALARY